MNIKQITALPITLLFALAAFAQSTQYAPDVRWGDSVQAHVGFANPLRGEVTVTLTGYTEAGEVLGSRNFVLDSFQRVYLPSKDLFDSQQIAWLKLESQRKVGAYVHYIHVDGKRTSMVHFNESSGKHVWVPNLRLETESFEASMVLVNTSTLGGTASSQPFYQVPGESNPTFVQAESALDIPNMDGALQQTIFDYPSLYGDQSNSLDWDMLLAASPASLAAVEHFGSLQQGGTQMASISLERTPRQEFIISHISRDSKLFWNQLVLINPYPGTTRYTMTTYLEDGSVYQRVRNNLQGYERKNIYIDSRSGFGIGASWMHIQAAEGGLVAYEIFGSPNSQQLAGLEPGSLPSSMVVLPHTPASDSIWTGVGIINVGTEALSVQVTGFDDSGIPIANLDGLPIKARGKNLFTTETLFGKEAAHRITWTRVDVDTRRDTISAFCLTGDTSLTHLAGLQGITNLAYEGRAFVADFEQADIENLFALGWKTKRFFDDGIVLKNRGFFVDFFESQPSGIAFVGYDANFVSPVLYNRNFLDSIGMMSPFFEVPDVENPLYLSFQIRFADPERAKMDSRYGLVWREEDSTTWNWFGVSGRALRYSGDFERVFDLGFYQDRVRYLTDWTPYQMQMPRSIRGKRIQVGFYYHAAQKDSLGPLGIGIFEGPIVLLDHIQLRADTLPRAFPPAYDSFGSFQHE